MSPAACSGLIYAGVPIADPGSVSALPLADDGINVRSPQVDSGVACPSGLARPQSTTSVSPCLPTITLPGLMSRWRTPGEWAYSMALQTSMNRRRSLRSSNERRTGVGLSTRTVELLDRLLEAVAADEPHRVVRPAAVVGAQTIDRDDAGMFQAAGDLGLDQEPLSAGRVVGVVVEDLLEGNLAIQLAVERDEHGAQTASGVWPQHAEPLAVAGRGADGQRHRAVLVGGIVRARADAGERRLDLRAADPRQALLGRLAGRDRGQALLHVTAVGLQVNSGQPFKQRTRGGGEVTAAFEVICQAPGFIERPRLEGSYKLALVDDPVLEREQPEKEMTVGGGGHGKPPGYGALRPVRPQLGNPVARGASHRANYRMNVRAGISVGPPITLAVCVFPGTKRTPEPTLTAKRWFLSVCYPKAKGH